MLTKVASEDFRLAATGGRFDDAGFNGGQCAARDAGLQFDGRLHARGKIRSDLLFRRLTGPPQNKGTAAGEFFGCDPWRLLALAAW